MDGQHIVSIQKVPLVCSQRLIVAILAFLGNFFNYSERVNLSLAILCMVGSDATSNTTLPHGLDAGKPDANQTGSSFGGDDTASEDQRGDVDWDKPMQSQLLAMYFYGYVFTQILGGWLSSKFGSRRVFAACQFSSAICTLLTPISARTHFYFTCAVRFILGLSAGTAFPAVHGLLGRWSPPLERSKLVSYTMAGPLFGLVVTLPVAGILCEYGFDNGWGSIFYLTGIFNLVWLAAWLLLTSDGPETHQRISEKERDYILNSIGKGTGHAVRKIPWVKMLKSRALWAVIIAHISSSYTTTTMLTSLPMFMKEALQFDIKQNGLLSSLPYVTQFLAGLVFGWAADKVIERGSLSVKNTRKIWQTTSSLGAAIMFCIAVQLEADQRYVIVAILCMATALVSANRGGYLSNHLDLAPSYSGILFGITNTCSNGFGVFAPIIAGALTPNKTAMEWRNVFYVTAGLCVVCSLAFILMAEGELQEWAVVDDQKEEDLKREDEEGPLKNGREEEINPKELEAKLLNN